jgi:hypothetical protein
MSPEFGYRFSHKFAFGLALSYCNSKGKNVSSLVDGGGIIIDGSKNESRVNSNSYAFAPYLKWNFKLIDDFSFALKFTPGMTFGDDMQKIYYNDIENSLMKNKWYSFNVSLDPGFEYLVKNKFAFMLNLGSVGYNHSKTVPVTTESYNKSVSNSFISNIGLNGLSVGMIFYLSRSGSSKI